jgi:hypothetical protein
LTGAAGPVDQASKHRKEARRSMHLVENDEPVEVIGEVELWLAQLRAVALRLEVNIQGTPSFALSKRERRFAHLPRSGEHDSRHLGEALMEFGSQPTA